MKIGIFGGTGLDDPEIMTKKRELRFDRSKVQNGANGKNADYGLPSDSLTTGIVQGVECGILSRHGPGHSYSPSSVNYRANLLLLDQFGCDAIIATYSVGSLREEIHPGHFVIMDQLIDRTQKRDLTYFDTKPSSWPGVCHVSFGEPYDKQLRRLLIEGGKEMDFPIHETGTCIAIEGPRFSTRAESLMYRQIGGHIIGMTQVPEAQLARELNIPFCAVGMVTDWDAWRGEDSPVTQADVNKLLQSNKEKMIKFLKTVLPLLKSKANFPVRKRPGEGHMLSV
ncbi:hypothetical protein ACHWQZ_G017810 [Mnemiopsis leidyi]